jgi:hypothetical protein
LKEVAANTGGCLFVIIYFGMGLLQLAAIASAFTEWTGLPFIIAFFVSLIIAYIPVVGVIVGILGAMDAWGWSFPAAVALFVAPYIIGIAFHLFMRSMGIRET